MQNTSSTGPVMTNASVAHDDQARSTRLLSKLALIGPAFVVGAWQFGPGNLASAIEAGSAFGYALIWVIVVSTVLMIFFTDMSVRVGIAAPSTMIGTIKQTLGKPIGVLAGVSVFFITLCFSVGNAAGSGLALSMLFGGSAVMWTLVCTLAVAFILLVRNVYRMVERILLAMVAMMAFGFIGSAFMARPDWGAGLAGTLPSLPVGSEILLIALVGTNFSINAAFFTSYATRTRKTTASRYRDTTITDTIPGIVAPGIMTALVIMVAAAVLGHTGERAQNLAQLANVFEPFAGPVGSTIFILGFFGAAFSSMLANATAGGTLLSDGLGWGGSFDMLRTKLLVGIILTFGLAVVAFAPGSRIQLIIFAQAMTVLVAPLLGILLVLMANNKLLGELRNTWWQNVFAIIGLVSIIASSVLLVLSLTGVVTR
ncbi:divalent metal cation transporter MntH [Mesorhizobium sp. L-8-10]|uniref:Nramp family divalent metal transporter n=1 Tax=Mesorhizobium sp. L-8-10 TaxID=2744523 RepID=UPI001925868D|nr:Nramp family divalent metal transporter [Mesorhizobium sp. L-8-10]BCH31137.1 divalent metal cation transporter MntH [Mesorhizobium sp. L-8-10]